MRPTWASPTCSSAWWTGDGWWPGVRTGADRPTGANGLFLAALSLRRRATGDPVHDEVMRGVGAFLVGQQEPSGAVLAVSELGRRSAGARRATGRLPPARRPGRWCCWARCCRGRVGSRLLCPPSTTSRAREIADEGYIARLPDHWAAYALGDLPVRVPRRHADSDLAARLAGYFGMRLRFEAGRTGEGLNLWVRWYPGPPAGVGTAGEGIGALHGL